MGSAPFAGGFSATTTSAATSAFMAAPSTFPTTQQKAIGCFSTTAFKVSRVRRSGSYATPSGSDGHRCPIRAISAQSRRTALCTGAADAAATATSPTATTKTFATGYEISPANGFSRPSFGISTAYGTAIAFSRCPNGKTATAAIATAGVAVISNGYVMYFSFYGCLFAPKRAVSGVSLKTGTGRTLHATSPFCP